MMNLEYTCCQENDIETIFSFSKELIDLYDDKNLIDYEKVLNWIRRKIAGNIEHYTQVQMDGKIVAYFHLEVQAEQVELDDLYVLPQFRGRGIGKKVLEKVFDITEKPIFLYVFKGNAGAISLYERMGFQVTEDVSPTRCIMVRNG